MAWGYVVGAVVGGVMANAQKKAEQERKNQVRNVTSQGIRDLQPLYADYRADAAVAAGLQFNQQNLAVANAQSGYGMEMSGYGRTNLAGFENPAIGDPTSRLQAIGIQNQSSLLANSQALENRLETLDAAERQLRGQALQSGVVLPSTDTILAQGEK